MREIPEVLGKFTSREVFLINCIRDLEKRVLLVETTLRLDNEQLMRGFHEGLHDATA